MRHVVAAGTDVASLLLFDPGALPADFDTRVQGRDVLELLAQLTEAGAAAWINTGADGAYLLHAYVGEPIPPSVQPYLREPLTTEAFAVPTGHVYFTGAEYAFRDDDRFLRRHPHMGGAFPVQPGSYRLTLWRTEYPEGLTKELLRQQVSSWAFRLFDGMGWLVMLAALGLVGLAATATMMPRDIWLGTMLPACILLLLLPLAVARTGPYRKARERFRVIEQEFPSLVALLSHQGPDLPAR